MSIDDVIGITAYDDLADGSGDQKEGHESWYSIAETPKPKIEITAAALDFDVVVVGQSSQRTIAVKNTGSANLIITSISSGNVQYVVEPTAFTVEPGNFQTVTVTFTPITNVMVNSNLKIVHNVSISAKQISVTGVGVLANGTGKKGIITSDTTWKAEGSPYYVVGNIQIPSGVTLTIEAGVVVKYLGAYEMLVKGAVIANGTAEAPIILTSQGSPTGITVLRFINAALGDTQLSHIEITEAGQGLIVGTGNTGDLTVTSILIKNTSVHTLGGSSGNNLKLLQADIQGAVVQGDYPWSGPILIQYSTISNSQITADSYALGITIQNSTVTNSPMRIGCCGGRIKIVDSSISESGIQEGGGSPVTGPLEIEGSELVNSPINLPSASVSIKNSEINYNGTIGMRFGNGTITTSSVTGQGTGVGVEITGMSGYNIGGSVVITKTTIQNNEIGIKISGANQVSIENSNLEGNTSLNIENKTTQDILAANNYWGIIDAPVIANTITDYYDDINFGKVVYSPILFTTADNPIIGPKDPSIIIINQPALIAAKGVIQTSSSSIDLVLSATSPDQMIISDEPAFPIKFQWEPFNSSKLFQAGENKYLYAKFKDIAGNESAIAFACLKPGNFNKITPSSGLNLSKNVTLSWGLSNGATSYDVCYDSSNDNSCTNWVATGLTRSKTLKDLKPGVTYYWQVRSRNPGGIVYANGNNSSYWSFKYIDTTPTVTSITRLDPNPSTAASLRYTVTFSEAVTGVDAADFLMTASGVSGAKITGVSGTGASRTVTVSTGTGTGTLRLDLKDNDSIKDLAGNALGGTGINNGNYTAGQKYTLDRNNKFVSTGTLDGWLLESSETSGQGGTIKAAGNLQLGDDALNKQYRSLLSFDTSKLPAGAVIVRVTLKLKKASSAGLDPFSWAGNSLLVDLRKGGFGKTTALEIGDFNAASTKVGLGPVTAAASGWYQLVFKAVDFTNINRSGPTQLRLAFKLDDNNNKKADYVSFFSGDYVTAANRPVLIVEYTLP